MIWLPLSNRPRVLGEDIYEGGSSTCTACHYCYMNLAPIFFKINAICTIQKKIYDIYLIHQNMGTLSLVTLM